MTIWHTWRISWRDCYNTNWLMKMPAMVDCQRSSWELFAFRRQVFTYLALPPWKIMQTNPFVLRIYYTFVTPLNKYRKKFWTVFSNSSIGTYFGNHQIHPIITRNTVVFVIRFKSVTRSYSNIIFLKKLEDKIPFLGGYWYPCFGLLVTSDLCLKARVDPSLAWFVTCLQWTPQINLRCDTCWPLECATQCVLWAQFRHVILTYDRIVLLTNSYYS